MTNFNRISNQFSPFHSENRYSDGALSTNEQLAYDNTLEQIWKLPSASRKDSSVQSSGADFLKRLGKQLVAFLTGEQHIRIWTTYSKAGVVWHVYDPVSDRHTSHTSESDLRVWLETRHLD